MSVESRDNQCPMMRFVAVFSGKWSIPIVYHLISARSAVRFTQLAAALQPITQKELSKQLKRLEQHKLISKTVYAEIPPKVEYRITPLGLTLQATLEDLAAWMTHYEQHKPSD